MLTREIPESPPQEEQEEIEELNISVEPRSTQEVRAELKSPRNEKSRWSRSDYCRNAHIRPRPDQPRTHLLTKHGKRRKCLRSWPSDWFEKSPRKATCRSAAIREEYPCSSQLFHHKQSTGRRTPHTKKGTGGFRRAGGTIDQIFILRIILKQANELTASICIIHFFDFESAFD